MTLPPFKLHKPTTVEEAINLNEKHSGHARFVAGGTDLFVNMKENLEGVENVIALSGISSLRTISNSNIGATVTLSELIKGGDTVPAVLKDAARNIAGPALREAATVGGNVLLNGRCLYYNRSQFYRCAQGPCMKAEGDECIAVPQKTRCYANFSSDLATVFVALDAVFVLVGHRGEREVPAKDFYSPDGISSKVLKEDEILSAIKIPPDSLSSRAKYLKLRARRAMDFPEAGVAVAVKRTSKDFLNINVGVGALGSMPLFVSMRDVEIGSESADELAGKIWKELSPSVHAVKNATFSPNYRKEMTRVFLKKLLKELLFCK